MTVQETGQPARLGSTPAAFGREPEIVDELACDGDAGLVAGVVVAAATTGTVLGVRAATGSSNNSGTSKPPISQ